MKNRMHCLEEIGPNLDPESDEREEEVEDLEYYEDRDAADLNPPGAASLPPPPVQVPPPPERGGLATPAGRRSRERELRANWDELRAAHEAADSVPPLSWDNQFGTDLLEPPLAKIPVEAGGVMRARKTLADNQPQQQLRSQQAGASTYYHQVTPGVINNPPPVARQLKERGKESAKKYFTQQPLSSQLAPSVDVQRRDPVRDPPARRYDREDIPDDLQSDASIETTNFLRNRRPPSSNPPSHHGEEPPTDLGKLAEAIFALANRETPKAETKSAARLQTVGLDNLKLDTAGRLNPITYFTWKSNIINTIDKMHLDKSIVLQLLCTKNHLPDKLWESIPHIANLNELFDRIEKQCPELGSAVTIVVKKIVGLRPCGSEAHAIESRCSELILAIIAYTGFIQFVPRKGAN